MLGVMTVFWVLLFIVFLFVAVRLVAGWSGRRDPSSRVRKPLERLQHRHAPRKISSKEYERRRSRLKRS